MNIATPQHQAEALQCLKNTSTGVLSTISAKGTPQSATVIFYCDDTFHLYFPTKQRSKKFENIKRDPHVAFVVTDVENVMTVQLEGRAEEVTDSTEMQHVINQLIAFQHNQGSSGWVLPVKRIEAGYFAFVKITPTWIRFGDFREQEDADDDDQFFWDIQPPKK